MFFVPASSPSRYKNMMRKAAGSGASAEGDQQLRVNFFWCCRDRTEFNSFKGLLKDDIRANSGLQDNFVFNLYMSGEVEVTDKKVAAEIEEMGKWTTLFTGRPNWNRVFKGVRKEARPGEHIGVFFCGPPPIASALKKASRTHSDKVVSGAFSKHAEHNPNGIYFDFHKENF